MVTNRTINEIPDHCFDGCSGLTIISSLFPQVTRIGKYAYQSTLIGSYSFPDSCTVVDEFAFSNCKSLSQIDLNNVQTIGNGAFDGCTRLGAVTFTDTVESIGSFAFRDCSSLATVVYEYNNILALNLFENCSSLSSITFAYEGGAAFTEIPNNCFKNCEALAQMDGVSAGVEDKFDIQTIGNYAFYNTGFTSIDLSLNQNSIGVQAFAEMQALEYAKVDVDMISEKMFYNCPELKTVIIGSNVSNGSSATEQSSTWVVGDNAFDKCESINSITFDGNNVIGNYMFRAAKALTTLTIPASIEYMGIYAFADCVNLEAVTLETTKLSEYIFANDESLKTLILPSTLTRIPAYAFYNSFLTSITIPSSVIYVGEFAFANSTSLATATIENAYIGDYMFYGCTSLDNLSIPACDYVGQYAFANCIGLYELDLTNATRISSHMFSGCYNLGTSQTFTLTIPDLTEVGAYAFSTGSVTIEGVQYNLSACINLYAVNILSSKLSSHMFDGCRTIAQVTIPASITVEANLGTYAFANCTGIEAITINSSYISEYMFDGCEQLLDATFGNNILKIGAYAFRGCSGLTNVSLEASTQLATIATGAFANCSSIKNLLIPSSVSSIGEGAFFGCNDLESIQLPFVGTKAEINPQAAGAANGLFGYVFGKPNTSLTHDANEVYVTESVYGTATTAKYTSYIPKSLTSVVIISEHVIQYGAFYNVGGITSIVLPGSTLGTLSTIGAYAFYNCDSLTSLTIPSSVTKIDAYAASECDDLEQVTIYSALLGEYMFKNDTSLKSASLSNLTSVARNAFDGCTDLETVNLNNSLSNPCTVINQYAFQNCTSLTSIVLPNSITTIGEGAFKNCTSCRFTPSTSEVTFLPSNLTTLQNSAFRNCDAIVNLVTPANLTTSAITT